MFNTDFITYPSTEQHWEDLVYEDLRPYLSCNLPVSRKCQLVPVKAELFTIKGAAFHERITFPVVNRRIGSVILCSQWWGEEYIQLILGDFFNKYLIWMYLEINPRFWIEMKT